jgi:hypothetical protein
MSLYAEEKGLGDIIKEVAQDKALVKPVAKKKKVKKQLRFVFKDEFESKGIASKDRNDSESYTYKNKSRFRFKFNDGSEQSNFMSMHANPGVGGVGSNGGSRGGGKR